MRREGHQRRNAETDRTRHEWEGLEVFFQAEDGIRDGHVTGVQTCALPIYGPRPCGGRSRRGSHRRTVGRAVRRSSPRARSEERRVGKERRGRWGAARKKETWAGMLRNERQGHSSEARDDHRLRKVWERQDR